MKNLERSLLHSFLACAILSCSLFSCSSSDDDDDDEEPAAKTIADVIGELAGDYTATVTVTHKVCNENGARTAINGVAVDAEDLSEDGTDVLIEEVADGDATVKASGDSGVTISVTKGTGADKVGLEHTVATLALNDAGDGVKDDYKVSAVKATVGTATVFEETAVANITTSGQDGLKNKVVVTVDLTPAVYFGIVNFGTEHDDVKAAVEALGADTVVKTQISVTVTKLTRKE